MKVQICINEAIKIIVFYLGLKDFQADGFVDDKVISSFVSDLQVLRIEINLHLQYNNLNYDVNKAIATEDLSKLEESLNFINRLMNQDHFKKDDSIDLFYSTSCDKLQILKKKHQLIYKIADTWKKSEISSIPENLSSLKSILSTIKNLKEQTSQYEGAFTDHDEATLEQLVFKIQDLEKKINLKNEMELKLKKAFENRDYNEVIDVLAQAQGTAFIDTDLLAKCKELAHFLNPVTRVKAVKKAFKKRSTKLLENAIGDYESAKITTHPELLSKAVKRFKKLKRIEELNGLLQNAIASRSTQSLKDALSVCDTSKTNVSDLSLYENAQKVFLSLSVEELRDALENAIAERSLQKITETLELVDQSE